MFFSDLWWVNTITRAIVNEIQPTAALRNNTNQLHSDAKTIFKDLQIFYRAFCIIMSASSIPHTSGSMLGQVLLSSPHAE